MARIRTIKPEFFTSEQVAKCSPTARLLFVGMWCFCDDNGVHPASLMRIKMEVFPSDLFDETKIQGLISELKNNGLIFEFSANDEQYWHVTGWKKHQRIEKPTYKYPSPPAVNSASIPRVIDDNSTTVRGVVGDRSTPDWNGLEWIGMEEREEHCREDAPAPQNDSEKEQKPKRMKKPTVDEVREFCREHNLRMDAEAFIAYFESNGWKVGKNSMVNWKAAARGWAKRERDNRMHHGGSQKPRIPTIEEERARKPAGERS